MVPSVYLYILTLLTAWIIYNVSCFLSNWVRAWRIGLPMVYAPITPDNPLWIALQVALKDCFYYMPFKSIPFIRYARLGWEFHDRSDTIDRLGSAFVLVTPHRLWLALGEEVAVSNMFSRAKDFTKPLWQQESLGVFGPNILVVEGAEWKRHRKIFASQFNDGIYTTVWDEAILQAGQMLDTWQNDTLEKQRSETTNYSRTLALHVLAAAGFKRTYNFSETTANSSLAKDTSSYRESLHQIHQNLLFVIVVPRFIFKIPFMPESWKKVGRAIDDFRNRLLGQLQEERNKLSSGGSTTNSFITNLARAEIVDEEDSRSNTKGSTQKLTETEIISNMFVFNFAGHDTTASALFYSFSLLAAHPEVQDWVNEEVKFYLGDGNLSSTAYKELFPKLKRCLAVMLETLRLYNPAPGIPKYVADQPTHITVSERNITIPPDTVVIPFMQGLHTYPRIWGEEPLEWKPRRWISISEDHVQGKEPFEHEVLKTPPKGSYFPWSQGPRECPGKKFAQVEFVAVMAVLFKDYHVEPVRQEGEDLDKAQRRLESIVKDSRMELLLTMRRAKEVFLKWSKRV